MSSWVFLLFLKNCYDLSKNYGCFIITFHASSKNLTFFIWITSLMVFVFHVLQSDSVAFSCLLLQKLPQIMKKDWQDEVFY